MNEKIKAFGTIIISVLAFCAPFVLLIAGTEFSEALWALPTAVVTWWLPSPLRA